MSGTPNKMKQLVHIWFFIALLGCENKSATRESDILATVISAPEVAEVGHTLELAFAFSGIELPSLLLENSYGPKIFRPEISEGEARFHISQTHTKQAGLYHWQLLTPSQPIASGSFQLRPKSAPDQIATYFGPRSIRAGGTDYSMLVVMPTDVYDNPLSDGTQIDIVRQLDNKIITEVSVLKDGLAWQLLYSGEKAGRMLVSATVAETASKELTSIISPSNATDFTITYERVHEFADGNQVISFRTSPIADRFDNPVNDGTLVSFVITTKEGIRLHTSGMTLAGVATGRLLHPEKAEEWAVNAFVTGEAKSESVSITFAPAVTDFKVVFSEDNRQIDIGPIESFMEQLVPDGLSVQLLIFNDVGALLETKTTTTRLGEAQFILEEGFFPQAPYALKMQLAGLEKEFKRTLGTNEGE